MLLKEYLISIQNTITIKYLIYIYLIYMCFSFYRGAKWNIAARFIVRYRPLRCQQSGSGQRLGTGHRAFVLEHRRSVDVQSPFRTGCKPERDCYRKQQLIKEDIFCYGWLTNWLLD